MKILVKAIAGSHLFGTATENSDHDYKGVFLPEAEDILLGKFDQTIHQHTNNSGNKNTKDDIDIEFYSLDKFLKMLYQGQTVALELLFTPKEYILEAHPLWFEIQANADSFISSKVSAFIGYTKTQADRYGIRGSRLHTIDTVVSTLERVDNKNKELGQIDYIPFLNLEHVEWVDKHFMNQQFQVLSICGKKFQLNTKIKYVLDPLKKYQQEYGERSRLAKLNQGVDFKALSHSIRVSMQAHSLLTSGKIQLPMSDENTKLLKEVKAGKYTYLEVAQLIEQHLDKVLAAQKTSTLLSEPNKANFDAVQISIYRKVINGEV